MNKSKIKYIIDFDSTFIKLEALDELFNISKTKSSKSDSELKEFERITSSSMNGRLSFSESLKKRMKLLKADRTHIDKLVKKLSGKVSSSVKRNKSFYKNHSEEIYIISGGFKELIVPVVGKFGIPAKNVFENTFGL